ncbi:ankyrin repeat-containing domain protein [Ephemerocybe angulata]|uniref:Ankyrin repeat-containing domain protein n=1 Tax=Ephemerocybe angulata TaxID=980116 RepID=A0A8H6HCX0_9AGAR|nr:ankyrin repeat-containing domain protein [Tulosesus angulatus]
MTVRGWGAGVKLLLAKPGIEVNAADTNGRTPLHVAAKGSHEAVIQLLLAAPGIDVNASDTDGRTPLHVAAAEDHEVILKLLLAAPGIDVNAPDTNEWTALTWAAFKGNEAIVKDLCAVPEIIVDVAGVKRRLEHPPEGELWDNPASKDEQDKCIRVLEELSKRGRAQDG